MPLKSSKEEVWAQRLTDEELTEQHPGSRGERRDLKPRASRASLLSLDPSSDPCLEFPGKGGKTEATPGQLNTLALKRQLRLQVLHQNHRSPLEMHLCTCISLFKERRNGKGMIWRHILECQCRRISQDLFVKPPYFVDQKIETRGGKETGVSSQSMCEVGANLNPGLSAPGSVL